MPYCPYIAVECFGAKFVFGSFDKAFSKIAATAIASGGEIETSELTSDQFEAFIDIFNDGLVSWSGVVDFDGNDIPCTADNKHNALPSMQKVAVVSALMEKMNDINEKKDA